MLEVVPIRPIRVVSIVFSIPSFLARNEGMDPSSSPYKTH